ncbi:TetR family transcriptional regulator [Pseudomonas sp. R2.Fl]|nr:TetR family transcriptional regulator [Pseudomonas sp. R2.Fl]
MTFDRSATTTGCDAAGSPRLEPSRKRRRRKSAGETRSEILDTAEELFRARGYAAVAIADVAAALDMSPANIFKHFRSKTSLIDAITTRHLSGAVERLEAMDRPGPAPERLRNMVRKLMEAHLRDLSQNPYIFEMILLTANLELECGYQYREMMIGRMAEIIEQGCREGSYRVGDVSRAARASFYALGSVLHPVMLANETADILATRRDEIVDLINAALQGPLAK